MRNNFNDLLDYEELIGEKIVKIGSIKAEYGRTYDRYVCIICESGKRIMIHGGKPHSPDPAQEEMEKLLWFFTPEEVAEKVREINAKKKQAEQDRLKRKKEEYNRLKKELGIKKEGE